MDRQIYANEIEKVVAQGPYSADWASLCSHPDPDWYRDAKFGIFIHWGAYSVPAFGNEWYARNMYLQGSPEYDHHIKTWGTHDKFGYKDFIPLFKAENYDPAAWADLFAEAGAKYVMPVAEHHDGFQMYDSQLSQWNAARMGPKRDVMGDLRRQVEARGMAFCASNHRAEHFWFQCGGMDFGSDIKNGEAPDFYGSPTGAPVGPMPDDMHMDLTYLPPTQAHMDDWLLRNCELVDRYRPKLVWFDWWVQHLSFKPYLKRFAAYYYNRAAQWGIDVAINTKYDAYPLGASVMDIERGQLSGGYPRLWQNDTSIAKNSWCYTENNDFKTAQSLVCDLVDVVSKNGCLLLNVGPRADGSITDEEQAVLREIGAWLKRNGEGIDKSSPWKVCGEGPTEIPQGYFKDTERPPFTAEDIRFTTRDGALYIYALKAPKDGVVRVRCLRAKPRETLLDTPVMRASVLGYPGAAVRTVGDEECMEFAIDGQLDTELPICIKAELY